MQLIVVFVAVLGIASTSLGEDDECAHPPKPPQGKPMGPPEICCKVNMSGGLFDAMKHSIDTCMEKLPKPPGPPPTGPPRGPPSEEMKAHMACMEECMFEQDGMLANKKLDKDAIMKKFPASDPELAKVQKAAIDKCFDATKDVDADKECKSGAMPFMHCLSRETFMNCPSSMWTSTASCEAVKTKMAKCPKMHGFFGSPHRGPPPPKQ